MLICVHAFVSVEVFILHNHHFIYAHDLGVSASVHPFFMFVCPGYILTEIVTKE